VSSITIIVPALNEEGNISGTLEEILPTLEKKFKDYEILIFNDGSTDRTGSISEEWSKKNSKIKVISHPKPMGLGHSYKKGVKMSVMDYVIMIPGDNDILGETYDQIFSLCGQKDIVIAYTGNPEIRNWGRRKLSLAFTGLMNFLFGMNLKYFNGIVIHKRDLIQATKIETDGFAYQAEALIKLIKSGKTYMEVPMYIRDRKYGKSKALNFRNIYRVLLAIAKLFVQVQIKKQHR